MRPSKNAKRNEESTPKASQAQKENILKRSAKSEPNLKRKKLKDEIEEELSDQEFDNVLQEVSQKSPYGKGWEVSDLEDSERNPADEEDYDDSSTDIDGSDISLVARDPEGDENDSDESDDDTSDDEAEVEGGQTDDSEDEGDDEEAVGEEDRQSDSGEEDSDALGDLDDDDDDDDEDEESDGLEQAEPVQKPKPKKIAFQKDYSREYERDMTEIAKKLGLIKKDSTEVSAENSKSTSFWVNDDHKELAGSSVGLSDAETDKERKAEVDERTLFLMYLPPKILAEHVETLFTSQLRKNIVSIDVRSSYRNKVARKSKSCACAFVIFTTPIDVEAAYKEVKGAAVNGTKLHVDFMGNKSLIQRIRDRARKENEASNADNLNPFCLHVRGLRKVKYTEAELKKVFPTASRIEVITAQKDGTNLPFFFVHYTSQEECKQAHDSKDGHKFKGRTLLVRYALKKPAQQTAQENQPTTQEKRTRNEEDNDSPKPTTKKRKLKT